MDPSNIWLGQSSDCLGFEFVTKSGRKWLRLCAPTHSRSHGHGLYQHARGPSVFCLGQDEGADYNYYYYHNQEYCFLYTSDFAGGLRVYNLDNGSLVFDVPTTYDDGSATGELSVYRDAIHVTGFTNEEPGNAVVQRFSALDGSPLPSLQFNAHDEDTAFFLPPNPALVRPIGILAVNQNRLSAGTKGKKSGKGMDDESGKKKGKKDDKDSDYDSDKKMSKKKGKGKGSMDKSKGKKEYDDDDEMSKKGTGKMNKIQGKGGKGNDKESKKSKGSMPYH